MNLNDLDRRTSIQSMARFIRYMAVMTAVLGAYIALRGWWIGRPGAIERGIGAMGFAAFALLNSRRMENGPR